MLPDVFVLANSRVQRAPFEGKHDLAYLFLSKAETVTYSIHNTSIYLINTNPRDTFSTGHTKCRYDQPACVNVLSDLRRTTYAWVRSRDDTFTLLGCRTVIIRLLGCRTVIVRLLGCRTVIVRLLGCRTVIIRLLGCRTVTRKAFAASLPLWFWSYWNVYSKEAMFVLLSFSIQKPGV